MVKLMCCFVQNESGVEFLLQLKDQSVVELMFCSQMMRVWLACFVFQSKDESVTELMCVFFSQRMKV